jgi:hypothetical protein
MRMDYPLFSSPENQGQYLAQLRWQVVEACNEAGLVLDFLKDVWALAEPRIGFTLPWLAASEEFAPPMDYVIVPLVRFPSIDTIFHLEEAVGVAYGGRRIDFEVRMASLFEYIFDAAPSTVGAAVKWLEGRLEHGETLKLLSTLLQQALSLCDHLTPSTGKRCLISQSGRYRLRWFR